MAGVDAKGLSVSYRPFVVTGAGSIGNITGRIRSISFVIDCVMGFVSAQIDTDVSRKEAEDWISYGLGRELRVKDEALDIVWEGFADRISAQLGNFTVSRGPLTGVINRCWTMYTLRDTTVTPPAVIPGWSTTIAQNTDSQDKYGTWERRVDKGECSVAEAQQERDRQLAKYAHPEAYGDLPLGGAAGSVALTIECQGYAAWLKAYPYADAVSGTVTVTTKLEAIMAADVNGIFSVDYSLMEGNAALASRYENSGSSAWTVALALAGIGDLGGNRWIFGIYEGRQAVYKKAPEGITYKYHLSEAAQHIEEVGVGEVYPWQIRPGRWMKILNLMSAQADPELQRYEDPRFMFIERVTYNDPYQVTLTGSRRSQLNQMISTKGFSGMGD